MTDTMTDSVTYKSLPTYWARTDASQGKDGLLLFYSDTTGGSMSREHVWRRAARASCSRTAAATCTTCARRIPA